MTDLILDVRPLGLPWSTVDPFLFCVHHLDVYPAGNDRLGPVASLADRRLGQDFEGRAGWRMYHGRTVPGFPQHPHRGFETVTVVRRGLVDHSDSLGATARYGAGDVQWLTAGAGIVHAEMFPLLRTDASNPLELFQIWLNLPAEDKLVAPHFSMFWSDAVPVRRVRDDAGRESRVTVVAGRIDDLEPLVPPPHSWASRPDADVAIWSVALDAEARVTLPPARYRDTVRTIYFFSGSAITVGGARVEQHGALLVRSDRALELEAGVEPAELLLLQGRPLGEPVAHHGPFVMNTRAEIDQAMSDFRRTGFGGWPWNRDDPVHPRDADRFARHADGRLDRPGGGPERQG